MRFFEFRPPVLWLAGLGILSGLLCAYAPETAEKFTILDVPVYQGLIFGIVIGFAVFRWGSANWISALLALVVTIAAWIAAMRGFYLITDDARTNIYIGGLVAGAIGAAGTILGGAITIPALRDPRSWILTVFVGAIAGMLVVPENFLLLFVIWQAAVAACIGHALTRHASNG